MNLAEQNAFLQTLQNAFLQTLQNATDVSLNMWI